MPTIWFEGLGARFADAMALPFETNAVAFGATFEDPGFAAGLGAGFTAGSGPRDPVEGRFARAGDGFADGLDPGLATGLGADGTADGRGVLDPREAIEGEGLEAGFEDGRGAAGTLLVGFEPRETIEGEGLLDGLETGFEDGRGAGREAIEGLREMLDERGGETRLIEGALGCGVTRETEGAREGCRTATGGLENPGLLETLGRDIGAMGLDGIERGADARGAKDWERPPEEPPPEFR